MIRKILFHIIMLLLCNNSIAFFAVAATEKVKKPPQEVEHWFTALGSLDFRKFNQLIANNAEIYLEKTASKQTKQDFINSLQKWNRETRKAVITYRYQTIGDNGTASVLVCYHFKSRQRLTLEFFTYANHQITGFTEKFQSNNCDNSMKLEGVEGQQ